MSRQARRTTQGLWLLGLAAVLLLPLGHGAQADHTSRLTLQAVQDHVDDLEASLDALTPVTCGDGVLDPGEACDGSTAVTCEDLGFEAGEVACNAACNLDTSGCVLLRFEDRGLTVFDHETGLEWEKKTDDGGVHDKDNLYTWSTGSPWDPDGTAFTVFLPALDGFAGSPACTAPPTCESADGVTVMCPTPPPSGCWRAPEIGELQTILDLSVPGCGVSPFTTPCIDPVFGPTAPSGYWSASSVAGSPITAWGVDFFNGFVFNDFKYIGTHVRAVRGGP